MVKAIESGAIPARVCQRHDSPRGPSITAAWEPRRARGTGAPALRPIRQGPIAARRDPQCALGWRSCGPVAVQASPAPGGGFPRAMERPGWIMPQLAARRLGSGDTHYFGCFEARAAPRGSKVGCAPLVQRVSRARSPARTAVRAPVLRGFALGSQFPRRTSAEHN